VTASVRADVPSVADTADKRVCPLRRLRIHGRMFRHNADTAPPLHVEDETSSEHGADSSWARLGRQKAFVGEASAMEAVAEVASEFVWAEIPAGCSVGMRTAGRRVTSREA
jgi:hypothetical protein